MKILSLSSSVAHGHVGNSALVPPLRRLGFQMVAVNSVQFSNHPGHGVFGGDVFAPAHVARIIDGLAGAGFLSDFAAILSGYLGDGGNGASLLRALDANPQAVYVCDPVIGDAGRCYVRPDVVEFLCGPALTRAHMLTPNLFELGVLSDAPVEGVDQAIAAARSLLAKGPKVVVVTSLSWRDQPTCAAISADGAWLVSTPQLDFPRPVHGGGDLLAGLLCAHWLRGDEPPAMLENAVSGLFAVLERSQRTGGAELDLTGPLDEVCTPPRHFAARQV